MDLGYRSLRRTTNVSDGSNAKDPLRANVFRYAPYKQTFSEPVGTWQKCQGAMSTEPLS